MLSSLKLIILYIAAWLGYKDVCKPAMLPTYHTSNTKTCLHACTTCGNLCPIFFKNFPNLNYHMFVLFHVWLRHSFLCRITFIDLLQIVVFVNLILYFRLHVLKVTHHLATQLTCLSMVSIQLAKLCTAVLKRDSKRLKYKQLTRERCCMQLARV